MCGHKEYAYKPADKSISFCAPKRQFSAGHQIHSMWLWTLLCTAAPSWHALVTMRVWGLAESIMPSPTMRGLGASIVAIVFGHTVCIIRVRGFGASWWELSEGERTWCSAQQQALSLINLAHPLISDYDSAPDLDLTKLLSTIYYDTDTVHKIWHAGGFHCMATGHCCLLSLILHVYVLSYVM